MADPWPSLPLEEWKDTYATLHRWTQIVGKIRLALSPWINHSWHVTLYVTARGLTTSPIWHGARTFQIDFDFIDHRLVIQDGEGAVRTIALGPRPVAALYRELLATLRELGLEVKIHPTPNELPDAVRLDTDREHAARASPRISPQARGGTQRRWRGLMLPATPRFRSRLRSAGPFWLEEEGPARRHDDRVAHRAAVQQLAQLHAENSICTHRGKNTGCFSFPLANSMVLG